MDFLLTHRTVPSFRIDNTTVREVSEILWPTYLDWMSEKYDSRSIHKLQNGIIPSIFKI